MKLAKFNIFETVSLEFEDKETYMSFNILYNGKKIGSIEYWINHHNICEIMSIEIDEPFRGKGYGSEALKLFKEESGYTKILADCVSQESFFTFVKAWGKPETFGNIFRNFDTYEEVKDYLPLKAPYDKDGHMVGSSDSSVNVYYEF
jgi:hypothetical protein